VALVSVAMVNLADHALFAQGQRKLLKFGSNNILYQGIFICIEKNYNPMD